MTKAVQKAVSAHTARLKAQGGTRITLLLKPQANAALIAYCEKHGVSRTVAVEKALMLLDEKHCKD